MDIAYTALTETCTLLLDTNGVCRSVLASSTAKGDGLARIPLSAERCIGAQYVASIDRQAPDLLVHTPKPGTQLLFAKIENDGRITLVRSAPLVRFEAAAPTAAPLSARFGAEGDERDLDYGGEGEQTRPVGDDCALVRHASRPAPRVSMQVPVAQDCADETDSVPAILLAPVVPEAAPTRPDLSDPPALARPPVPGLRLRPPAQTLVADELAPDSLTQPFRRAGRR